MANIKTINSEIGKSRQGVSYTELLEILTENPDAERDILRPKVAKKVRVRIYSDSYDFQSYAKAELYSPERGEWSEIASRHYSQMGTPTKLAYLPDAKGEKPAWFQIDRDYLVDLVVKILTP